MKKIGVITDSHSGITQERAKELGVLVLPMPFYIDETCYYEGINLSWEEFLEKVNAGAKVSTSQPSPQDVMSIWDKGLLEYEELIYIPISSGISGSCSTATALSMEEPYKGKVFVVDNGRVSTPLHRCVLDTIELIEEGYCAEQIKEILEEEKNNMVIYVAVDDLLYLKNGGRITPAAASVATLLNIKPVLRFDIGNLDVHKKCRGFCKAKAAMIEAIKLDLNTVYKEYYDKGEYSILVASSASEEETDKFVTQVKEAFPGLPIQCDRLTLGLTCHIGPGGLGISCSCRPKRPAKK